MNVNRTHGRGSVTKSFGITSKIKTMSTTNLIVLILLISGLVYTNESGYTSSLPSFCTIACSAIYDVFAVTRCSGLVGWSIRSLILYEPLAFKIFAALCFACKSKFSIVSLAFILISVSSMNAEGFSSSPSN